MIGAIFNTYRGMKENKALKSRKDTLEKELNELDSIDKILVQIKDPYERVVAQNQLALAEYMNERQNGQSMQVIKNKWKVVKKQMIANIEATEAQLKNVQATKLDIARIVATLSQLSNELDLELEEVKQRVSMNEGLRKKVEEFQDAQLITKVKNQSIDLLALKRSINEFVEEYGRFKVQLEQGNTKLTNLDKAHTAHKENYEKYKYTTDYKLSELQTKTNDIHKNVDAIVNKMQEVTNELSALNELVDTRMDNLECAFQDHKRQWAERVNQLDQTIQVKALQTKKLILKLTIPLYVSVVGIIIAMFIF